MEYSLRAMELWFQHLPGSLLLELEKESLSSWFSQRTGKHCLQIGGPSDLRLIDKAHYINKIYLSSQFASSSYHSRVQSELDSLPVYPESLDAIVVVHLLEFAESPEIFIRETYRGLAAGGHLVLLVFNPWSLWGMARLRKSKQGFPWSGNFYSGTKVRRWLRRAGYSIILNKTLCFRPVWHDSKLYEQFKFLETFGAYCLSGFGAVSLFIAQKKEIGMTPIKVQWNRRQTKVRNGIIEPTSYR